DLEVGERGDRHTFLADLAARARMIGVVAHQCRHVEGGGEPGLALLEEILEARVGVFGPPEAGEHPHRPQPAAVHGRIDAARERILAGRAELLVGRPRSEAPGCLAAPDGYPREGLEPHRPLLVGHASSPRTSRAMTSFWICEVPS